MGSVDVSGPVVWGATKPHGAVPPCVRVAYIVRVKSSGENICWVFRSWAVAPLGWCCVFQYLRDAVTNKGFPPVRVTADRSEVDGRITPQGGLGDIALNRLAKVTQETGGD
jgi:hypothetical protein